MAGEEASGGQNDLLPFCSPPPALARIHLGVRDGPKTKIKK